MRWSYNPQTDKVEGYVDCGDGEKTDLIATHALVVKLRGLTKRWKQPVAYALAGNSTECKKMKNLLIKVVNRIKAIGLKPLILICDQGGPMWSLHKTHLKVTVDKP